jgi:hypothetical protein
VPKDAAQARQDENATRGGRKKRDTYHERNVYTTIRDLGDKFNEVPPENPNKHYKNRSKYDARGRRINDD